MRADWASDKTDSGARRKPAGGVLNNGKLQMPLQALGGEKSFGTMMAAVMRTGASNVTEGVAPPRPLLDTWTRTGGNRTMLRPLTCLLGSALLATAAFGATPAAPEPRPAPVPAPTPASIPATAKSAPSPANPAAAIAEVEAAVRAWAAAWSARDVTRYLASYSPEFTPSRGQDRKAWEADRRARIADKAAIRVDIDSLVISVTGEAASASFQQTYSADKLREKSRKTLELRRVGNQWLIRKEIAGG